MCVCAHACVHMLVHMHVFASGSERQRGGERVIGASHVTGDILFYILDPCPLPTHMHAHALADTRTHVESNPDPVGVYF